MRAIRKGDRVRLIENYGDYFTGNMGEVIGQDNRLILVKFDNYPNRVAEGIFDFRLEKIKSVKHHPHTDIFK
jgi:hypothetical protein